MSGGGKVARIGVFRVARRMWELGLVAGSSGNVSLRKAKVIYITPSGVPYRHLHPRMIVAIDPQGRVISGPGTPSTEWRLHVYIYREFPEVRAVVHTHSPFATAAAVRGELPLLTDEARLHFPKGIPVAPHAPPGTWELAQRAVEALRRGSGACLLQQHGVVAVGETLAEALHVALSVEEAARIAFLGRIP